MRFQLVTFFLIHHLMELIEIFVCMFVEILTLKFTGMYSFLECFGGLLLQLASNSVLEVIIIVHIFLQKQNSACSILSRWSLICIAWLLLLQSVWVSPFFHSFWFRPELNKLGWSPAVISPQPFTMKLNWKEYSNKILPGIVSARFINGPTNCAAKIDT